MAATAVLAVTLTACGNQGADPAAQQSSTQPSSGQPSQAPSDNSASAITSVRLSQSGGVAGFDRTFTVTEDTPGAQAVFAAASARALGEASSVKGVAPCCDLFQYDITINHADGSVTAIRTYDTGIDPAEQKLIDAVLNTDVNHTDTTQK